MKKDSLIFGIHAVMAALEKNNVEQVIVNQDKRGEKIKRLIDFSKKNACDLQFENGKVFEKKFEQSNHQGVVALLKNQKQFHEADIKSLCQENKKPLLILMLDGVTDPHNLGACLRSADASGVSMVIAPKDKNASITPVVRKVASGAAETVPFIPVTNLARTMALLKDLGVWLFGACGEADNDLYETDFNGDVAIIMGSEGSGLRRLTRERCDALFSIPMIGEVESLNVSVATGVSLYEVVRQRRVV